MPYTALAQVTLGKSRPFSSVPSQKGLASLSVRGFTPGWEREGLQPIQEREAVDDG